MPFRFETELLNLLMIIEYETYAGDVEEWNVIGFNGKTFPNNLLPIERSLIRLGLNETLYERCWKDYQGREEYYSKHDSKTFGDVWI